MTVRTTKCKQASRHEGFIEVKARRLREAEEFCLTPAWGVGGMFFLPRCFRGATLGFTVDERFLFNFLRPAEIADAWLPFDS
jgi:hypothetical protein